jgi:hypothetical protein
VLQSPSTSSTSMAAADRSAMQSADNIDAADHTALRMPAPSPRGAQASATINEELPSSFGVPPMTPSSRSFSAAPASPQTAHATPA